MRSGSRRRQQILESLAAELESNGGDRITTARLAQLVGVSEAALYRHFPSKAKMFEALIIFAEDTIAGLTNKVLTTETNPRLRLEMITTVMLTFSSRNPGITRVLLGDALAGEHERLRARVAQFFHRFETQIKQVLRDAEQQRNSPFQPPASILANLLVASVEGRMAQFCRDGFKRSPMDDWPSQWEVLARSIF